MNAQFKTCLMELGAQALVNASKFTSTLTTADVLLGGLIVLCLFLLGWDVPRCIREFDTLARQFFIKRQKESQSPLGYLHRVFKCWLSDGCYDVSSLEVTLKSCFGLSRRMFDAPTSISGIKVGVTASTISDASSFVFSNYNGLGTRAKECGKNINIMEASTGFPPLTIHRVSAYKTHECNG